MINSSGHEIEKLKLSSTFCSAPWTHAHVALNGDVSPCCDYDGVFGSVTRNTIEEVWFGPAFSQMRQTILSGKPYRGCHRCQEAERRGHYSHRNRMNHDFGQQVLSRMEREPHEVLALPSSIDLRFSNLCNFRCRMCFYGSSTSWTQEALALGDIARSPGLIRAFDNFDDLSRQFEPILPNLSHVYFAGGEPLITPAHYAFLELLHERGLHHVWLSYNSNLSTLSCNDRSVLDYWAQFPQVEVEGSIDGAGALGELIRKGLSWDAFTENVKSIQQRCPHVRMKYGVTVSLLNIFHLEDLITRITNELGAEPTGWRIYPLTWPDYYSVRVLPPDLKREAASRLRRFVDDLPPPAGAILNGIFQARPHVGDQIQTLIRFMESDDESHKLARFRQRTLQLDLLRGEEAKVLIPEIAHLLELP